MQSFFELAATAECGYTLTMEQEKLIEEVHRTGKLLVDVPLTCKDAEVEDPAEQKLLSEMRLGPDGKPKENTVVSKLINFSSVIHGYWKFAPSAFDEWLSEFNAKGGKNKRFPMLANHNLANLIGSWLQVEKTAGGLVGAGEFSMTDEAQKFRQLMMEGHLQNVSIGVWVDEWKAAPKDAAYKEVAMKARIFETSVTPVPADKKAKVEVVASEPATSDEPTDKQRLLQAILAEQRGDTRNKALRELLTVSRVAAGK